MKNAYIVFLLLISLSACNKKTVLLPEIENAKTIEVTDVSPIYMFYDEETDSIEFNRKNMISTTNWLINIDKRLTLKQVLPHLQYLQEKRHGDGMHKNENAKNYFTCNDTSRNSLGFIDFTDVIYQNKPIENYLAQLNDSVYHVLRFTKDSIFVNGNSIEYEKLKYYLKILAINKAKIILRFEPIINFQDYISIKESMSELNSSNFLISNEEFIY